MKTNTNMWQLIKPIKSNENIRTPMNTLEEHIHLLLTLRIAHMTNHI